MTQSTGVDLDLLARCYRDTGEVLAAIPAGRWDAPSPCTEWTVRQVADHLVDALDFFASTVSGRSVERPADLIEAYRDATARCLDAFGRAEALTAEHPFPDGTLPGRMIANISLSESLVHGWDLATGAGLPYSPDPDAVAAVDASSNGPRRPEMFADPVPVPAGAPPFAVLLGKLGRVA
ncbi:TIGR03086 family metal-binding protein [Actinophytocola sp.]|uniref:TIGR03086 family metal-binding protein n=1 Tax=Actinophytocola sp. TaxID=1872138 RepID=UPI003D6A94AD